MNGPENYAAAQQRLKDSSNSPPEMAMIYATEAVAHATLALAAATVDMTDFNTVSVANANEWIEVTK